MDSILLAYPESWAKIMHPHEEVSLKTILQSHGPHDSCKCVDGETFGLFAHDMKIPDIVAELSDRSEPAKVRLSVCLDKKEVLVFHEDIACSVAVRASLMPSPWDLHDGRQGCVSMAMGL